MVDFIVSMACLLKGPGPRANIEIRASECCLWEQHEKYKDAIFKRSVTTPVPSKHCTEMDRAPLNSETAPALEILGARAALSR
jgi:hypothetical protein